MKALTVVVQIAALGLLCVIAYNTGVETRLCLSIIQAGCRVMEDCLARCSIAPYLSRTRLSRKWRQK